MAWTFADSQRLLLLLPIYEGDGVIKIMWLFLQTLTFKLAGWTDCKTLQMIIRGNLWYLRHNRYLCPAVGSGL